MKTVEWDEWVKRRRAMAGMAAAVAEHTAPGRARSRRARTPEERELIVRGTVALMRKRDRDGRLVRMGPQRYRLNPAGDVGRRHPPRSAARFGPLFWHAIL